MKIKRDIHGRYHDERGRFTKIELEPGELESLLAEVKLRRIGEHTFERDNEEFVFEEKRKPDEIFLNISLGCIFVVIFSMWAKAFW